MKRWSVLILVLLILTTVNWVAVNPEVIALENPTRNPLEWLDKLETEILGQPTIGNLMDRLATFEETMVGRIRDGSLVQRLAYLESLLYTNQPYDISVNYKLQALEWVIFRQVYAGALDGRVARLENALFGSVSAGPIASRLEKMVSQVFPGGTVNAHWTSVSEGTLVKVKIMDEISSARSQVGDSFRFMVMETVVSNNMIIIPKGTVGYGKISKVTRPRNLGIDARLMLDFGEVRALDSTPVALFLGAKASDMNRSRQLAVGASTAGMLILGPEGILIGMAVKGKEKTIPVDTEYFIQVKKPVRIYTLQK
ncbi:MAG TPA: hypothetical protein VEC37_02360 [Bacillota bacterium]|nr:hypothetical protein [Bacillota bacterium]